MSNDTKAIDRQFSSNGVELESQKVLQHFRTRTSGFMSEKEFVDFIETNIKYFVRDVLRAEYLRHIREWDMRGRPSFGGNAPRIDLMIETADGRRFGIECKYPTTSVYGDLSRSVSQILSYAVIARENEVPLDRLFILTTDYNDIINKVIQAYELPIDLVVFSRTQRAEWHRPERTAE